MRIEEVGGGLKVVLFFLGSKACQCEIRTVVFFDGELLEKHTDVGSCLSVCQSPNVGFIMSVIWRKKSQMKSSSYKP